MVYRDNGTKKKKLECFTLYSGVSRYSFVNWVLWLSVKTIDVN